MNLLFLVTVTPVSCLESLKLNFTQEVQLLCHKHNILVICGPEGGVTLRSCLIKVTVISCLHTQKAHMGNIQGTWELFSETADRFHSFHHIVADLYEVDVLPISSLEIHISFGGTTRLPRQQDSGFLFLLQQEPQWN